MKRIDKVKTHFKENKRIYFASIGGLIVGAVTVLALKEDGNLFLSRRKHAI